MTQTQPFAELLQGHVAQEFVQDLARYGELLEHWGARHNLVKVGDRQELVERHLLESLAPLDVLGDRGCLLDVGSGAGLPGIPILCVKRGWSGVLMEPRSKRWAFLKTVIRELKLDAEVVRTRFEDLVEGRFDLITARAVGRHEEILEWSKTRLKKGGMVGIWGTREEERRLGRNNDWRMLSSRLIGLEQGRLLLFQVCST